MSGKREQTRMSFDRIELKYGGGINVFPSGDKPGLVCVSVFHETLVRLTTSEVRAVVKRLQTIKPLKKRRGEIANA